MIKQFFKKVLISYLIIVCCIFTPTYRAYAASSGGWAFNAFDAATSVLTAFKNGTSAATTVARSPVTGQIAKGVLGGIASGAAVGLAISSIINLGLDAFDWLADPENNAVKWKPKGTLVEGTYADGKQFFGTSLDSVCSQWFSYMQTIDGVKQRIASGEKVITKVNATAKTCQMGTGSTYWWTLYAGTLPNDWQSIPVDVVANKIYDNAKTDIPSKSTVNDAVKTLVDAGAYDKALDNAKTDTDAGHACGTGTHWNGSACVADTPTTPTTPTTPDTPFDPSGIIDAIKSVFNAVMSIPDVINSSIDKVMDALASITDVINAAIDKLLLDIKDFFKPLIDLITDFINWFKGKFTALYDMIAEFFDWVKTTYDDFVKPGDNEPTELDIPSNVPTPTDTNIRFGGMCPPNAEINVRIPFASINATLFDWSKWCYNLDTFVKPVIILLAAYFSVLIFRGKNESS